MKKILLLIAVLTVTFYGCKKDNVMDDKASLTGKWTFVKDSINFYEDGKLVSTEIDFFPDNDQFVQFNSDGTGFNDHTTFTYKTTNKDLTFSYAAFSTDDFNYPALTVTEQIAELTKNKLSLAYVTVSPDHVVAYSIYKR